MGGGLPGLMKRLMKPDQGVAARLTSGKKIVTETRCHDDALGGGEKKECGAKIYNVEKKKKSTSVKNVCKRFVFP